MRSQPWSVDRDGPKLQSCAEMRELAAGFANQLGEPKKTVVRKVSQIMGAGGLQAGVAGSVKAHGMGGVVKMVQKSKPRESEARRMRWSSQSY